jgi:hypothetical protein
MIMKLDLIPTQDDQENGKRLVNRFRGVTEVWYRRIG